MSNERNALKAGLFIVVSVALAIATVIGIKGTGAFAEPTQIRSVSFKLTDDLGGLRVGDDVRVGGFKAGTVRSIDPVGAAEGGDAQLLVTFSLPRKYVLREGARVGVQTGLTGNAVLNIQNLGSGNALADNVVLVGAPDPKSALFAGLGDITPGLRSIVRKVEDETLPRVHQTADSAAALIDHVKGKVDPVVDRYNNVADRAGETMVNARDTMAHARDLLGEGKGDLKSTFSNLNAATGTVKERLPATFDQLKAVLTKTEGSIDKVQTTLGDLRTTMANAKDVSASARSVLVGNRSKLDSMVASLKTTGDNLKAASGEIRRSPWRLLYKPGKGELANLNLYDSARQFAEGANDLNDAASALRDALATDSVDDQQVQLLVQRLDKSFAGFEEVEDKLWRSVRE